MTWRVSIVPHEYLTTEWPRVAPMLAPAVVQSKGRYDMRSLFEQLREGYKNLWIVYGDDKVVVAAFTTRVAEYPLRAMLNLDFIGGKDMPDWFADVQGVLDRYVVDAELDGIETCGRLGWDRQMRHGGWERTGMMHERGRHG